MKVSLFNDHASVPRESHMVLHYFVFRSVLFVVVLVLALYVRYQSVEEYTTTRVQWLLGRIRLVLHEM